MNNRSSFFSDLKSVVASKGLSAEYISTKTGYKTSTINRIMDGKYSPNVDVLFNILNAINCKLVVIPTPHHYSVQS